MELPCDRCAAKGRKENPVFFVYARFDLPVEPVNPPKKKRPWLPPDRWFWRFFGTPVLVPLDAVTRERKVEHANDFHILATELSVVCTICIANGDQDNLEKIKRYWCDDLSSLKEGSYNELLSHLTKNDRERLGEARRQVIEERGVELQVQGHAEYFMKGGKLKLPRIEGGRGHPARHALNMFARELFRALKVKYRGCSPQPRIERLRVQVGRLLLEVRSDRAPAGIPGSVAFNEKLLEWVRKLQG